MSFIVALLIWAALHLYVFWRMRAAAGVRRLPRWVLWLVALFLALSYLLSRFAETFGMPHAAATLEVIGANWIGILFLTFVCLLAAELITGFGRLMPADSPRIRTAAFLLAGGLSAIAFIQAARAPVVGEHTVVLRKLPAEADGMVVVVLSDLHLGLLRNPAWFASRVDQVHALRPDLIILAGDLVEGHGADQRVFQPLLQQLTAPLGVWGVTGNHEFYGQAAAGKLVEEAGVRMLRDSWAEVRPGLVLAGVEDLTVRRSRLGSIEGFVERAMSGRPPGAVIFLSHSPWKSETAARLGAGLMISGHTHNGQLWPFTYFVQVFYPLIAGRYEVQGMPVIVGRGTGTWGPRMRLWRRGEILRITLRAG